MKKTFFLLLLFLSIIFSSHLTAANPQELADWAKKVLKETLAATWQDTPEKTEAVSKYYMPSAFIPMQEFFMDKVAIIKAKQLTMHPQLKSEPTIVFSGSCGLSKCWRVNLSYILPQLNQETDFSLLIMSTNPGSDSPFIIQSLNITLHDYPAH